MLPVPPGCWVRVAPCAGLCRHSPVPAALCIPAVIPSLLSALLLHKDTEVIFCLFFPVFPPRRGPAGPALARAQRLRQLLFTLRSARFGVLFFLGVSNTPSLYLILNTLLLPSGAPSGARDGSAPRDPGPKTAGRGSEQDSCFSNRTVERVLESSRLRPGAGCGRPSPFCHNFVFSREQNP